MLAAALEELEYLDDAAPYFMALSDLTAPVWLDSSGASSHGGRYDIMTAEPASLVTTKSRALGFETRIENFGAAPCTQTSTKDPYTILQQQLDMHSMLIEGDDKAMFDHLPFSSGLCGFWGYELGAPSIAKLNVGSDESGQALDDMRVGLYFWALVVDHAERKTWLAFTGGCQPALRENLLARLNSAKAAGSNATKRAFYLEPFTADSPIKNYLAAVEKIQEYIHAGDCYQVNYAQRFSSTYGGCPLSAYLHLRKQLPSPYSAFIPLDDGAILSLSPERFMRVAKGRVSTRPIKGTAARGLTPKQDSALASALQHSEKDRAENLMIVDLLRNDLGRVSEYGSVSTDELFALESFANVHHLVSTVTSKLRTDAKCTDLLRSSFPGGSITGAPKVRAMEIIGELEQAPRSVYCGSIGYIGFNGNMDTSIAIRTLVASKGNLYCWGGGGIVADSSAAAEHQESLDKVGILMRSLEANFGR